MTISSITGVNSLRDAADWFVANWIKRHSSRILEVGKILGQRGPMCIIFQEEQQQHYEGKSTRFYLMFKREWFHSFQYIYKKPNAGWGQTVNMRILNQAATYERETGNDVKLVTVMPDGAYYIDAITMYDYVDENRTIRTPAMETDQEGSCPSKLWIAYP